jgi:hypothetical protein
VELARAELVLIREPYKMFALRKALEAFRQEYDLILVDSNPPNLRKEAVEDEGSQKFDVGGCRDGIGDCETVCRTNSKPFARP